MRKACLFAGVSLALSSVVSACMDRPVTAVEPHTSNLYVEPLTYQVVDKIDLLFMIDNSISMGDKQALLASAVPQLVQRLVVPRCTSGAGEVRQRTTAAEACPAGFAPEFRAVDDIHVAVISSSLGNHGAGGDHQACNNGSPDHDRAQLLPKVRDKPLDSYAGTGFLAWDPKQKLMPPGDADPAHLGSQFADMVKAAGEDGCGYEASLESWYRFLVDPEPPSAITVNEKGRSIPGAVDTELLAQRAAFLRPDSMVAIVMLTDENDCSIRDDEIGNWLANGDVNMPRATSVCEKNPNDRCCMPCTGPFVTPEGCPDPKTDSACLKATTLAPITEDPINLRCLKSKQRYGYDFLYPTSRYVEALTRPLVSRRSDGMLVENPLFQSVPGKARRDRGMIYLAGIVGVPWQDIATPESLTGAGLKYMNAEELTKQNRWSVLVGDPASNAEPGDPFMRESTEPRSGINPITGDAIVAETSLNPRANAINGHEQKKTDGTDLQYACTFSLKNPAPCTTETCDCRGPSTDPMIHDPGELDRNRPLCQPPAGGAPEPTQYFGKAYPGLRPLEVLKGIGDSAIVASICPKVLDETQPAYGYQPAVDAIVERLKIQLLGRCPPRPLEVTPDGSLPCVVVEAQAPALGAAAACSCAAERRRPASAAAQNMVRQQLAERQQCGTATTPACADYCLCELQAAEGAARDQCLNDVGESATPGYCYVDPFGDAHQGNPALVEKCEEGKKRLVRFVGPNTPTPGSTTFIACLGATLH